jgi:hypothetical protein
MVIVGAGFPLAIWDNNLPSTANLLKITAEKDPDKFPIIKRLIDGPCANCGELSPSNDLNYVWTNITFFGIALISQYKEIRQDYSNFSPDSCITKLIRCRLNKFDPLHFISTMLEIEIKHAISLYYKDKGCPDNLNDLLDLKNLLTGEFTQVTWLSLNYDVVLESLIDKEKGASDKWKYCFEQFFPNSIQCQKTKHIIIKPHGSVNVWFNTDWNQNTHCLKYERLDNLLVTCDPDKIGCASPHDNSCEERRPWLVGYLPDFMKGEHNSPGAFADCAHDLCKLNLTYAALSLYSATSVYVLGYSMPSEDVWLWNRFKALPQTIKDKINIYVASGKKTDRIIKTFKDDGFVNVKYLSTDNRI